jgi:hypothetical protein
MRMKLFVFDLSIMYKEYTSILGLIEHKHEVRKIAW